MRNAVQLAKDLDVTPFDSIFFTNGIITAPTREVTEEGIERDMAIS